MGHLLVSMCRHWGGYWTQECLGRRTYRTIHQERSFNTFSLTEASVQSNLVNKQKHVAVMDNRRITEEKRPKLIHGQVLVNKFEKKSLTSVSFL